MEDTAWERLAEERGMSKQSPVRWEDAPKGTLFFAEGCFRDICGRWWHEQSERWYEPADSDISDIIKAEDYEARPTITPQRMDEILADAMVAANKVVADVPVQTGAIKSDGGSSGYYDIQLPDWLIDLIIERRYIKTEELIEVLGSDFDLGNIIKCAVRINSLQNGVGKAGNDVTYDSNKIIYSAGRLKERDKR